MLNDDHQS